MQSVICLKPLVVSLSFTLVTLFLMDALWLLWHTQKYNQLKMLFSTLSLYPNNPLKEHQ